MLLTGCFCCSCLSLGGSKRAGVTDRLSATADGQCTARRAYAVQPLPNLADGEAHDVCTVDTGRFIYVAATVELYCTES